MSILNLQVNTETNVFLLVPASSLNPLTTVLIFSDIEANTAAIEHFISFGAFRIADESIEATLKEHSVCFMPSTVISVSESN